MRHRPVGRLLNHYLAHYSRSGGGYDAYMTTTRPGAAALAAALIALGILGLGTGDFAMVWQPVPQWVPGREILAYAFGAASLAAGLGFLWRRTTRTAFTGRGWPSPGPSLPPPVPSPKRT